MNFPVILGVSANVNARVFSNNCSIVYTLILHVHVNARVFSTFVHTLSLHVCKVEKFLEKKSS